MQYAARSVWVLQPRGSKPSEKRIPTPPDQKEREEPVARLLRAVSMPGEHLQQRGVLVWGHEIGMVLNQYFVIFLAFGMPKIEKQKTGQLIWLSDVRIYKYAEREQWSSAGDRCSVDIPTDESWLASGECNVDFG